VPIQVLLLALRQNSTVVFCHHGPTAGLSLSID
jgi:hypothetical protein